MPSTAIRPIAVNIDEDTGLHVTQQEADAWLAKLEDCQDAKPPVCHV